MSDLDLAFILGVTASDSVSTADQSVIVAKVAKAAKVKGTALPNVQGETKVKGEAKSTAKVDPAGPRMASKPIENRAPLPEKGTYDGRSFLLAMRKAHGRDEQIAAIAGYLGYDPKQTLGQNEFTARLAAKRETAGPVDITGPSREDIRTAQRSVAGFVAGMPDNLSKYVANLKGRAEAAAEELAKAEVALSLAESDQDKATAKATIDLQTKIAKALGEELDRVMKAHG